MSDPSVHHVGITVSDLDRLLPFYRDVLGLSVVDRFSVSGEAFADAVDVDGATGTFVHLATGETRIELVEYEPAGASRSAERLDQGGTTHIGLTVDDLEAFHDDLPADVESLSEPRTTESGTTICFLRDPEGNLVELLEA